MEANLMPVTEVNGAGILSALLTYSGVRQVATSGVHDLAFLLL